MAGAGAETVTLSGRVRRLDQSCVYHCGWMLKAAPLFRSSDWSHRAGGGRVARAAGMVSWLGCRGPQGPGSCHR